MNRNLLTWFGLLALGLSGCGGEVERPKVHPASGRLVVGGLPAAHARLALHPADGRAGPLPVATTGPDGAFRFMTYSVDDGAPVGEYVVTVLWPNDGIPVDECADPVAHDRLYGFYCDPAKSPLRVTIHPGPNEVTLDVPVGSKGWWLPRKRDMDGRK